MIQVAAAIIRNDQGDILLCRRGPGGECAGLWEFPGGKIEPGETAYDCIVREIREELGVRIWAKSVLLRTTYTYPARAIDFTFFDAAIQEGGITPRVHREIVWVKPEDILTYDLCPADREAAPALIGRPRPLYAHSAEEGLWQTLADHLEGTARLAEAFAAAFGCGEWGCVLGQLHDTGKARPAFWPRLEGKRIRVEHAATGALQALDHGGLVGTLAPCIAGHHAGLPDPLPDPRSKKEQVLTPLSQRIETERSRPPVGAVVPVRWPAASPPMRPLGQRTGFTFSLWLRMLFSCLVDADCLDTETFMQGPQPRGGGEDVKRLSDKLDSYMERFAHPTRDIDSKRCEILADCRQAAEGPQGLYTLTVPTGGGKTLASLAFALRHAARHGLARVIYVIPYTSIIEQTARTFRGVLGSQNVLEHTSAAEPEEDDRDEAAYARRLAAENWDAPVVVTTNVQFFESLMANKPARCRKLHNIAGSVVIFDEAQMLPVEYLIPCVRLIAELVRNYRATAVLCTATQPSLAGYFPKDMPAVEICRETEELYTFFRRVRYEMAGVWTDERIYEEFQACPQMLVVVNSRAHAQAIFERMEGMDAYCLTTLLTPVSRKEKLDEIRRRLKEGQPCRVVSTSLIEAGVDVDFPRVCREAAGLDSVIQAAGRCNREGRRSAQESVVSVFSSEERWAGKVPKALMRPADAAAEVAQDQVDIASPEAIGQYFARLYKLSGSTLDREGIVEMLDASGNTPVFERAAQSFRLIEEGTRSILVPQEPEAQTCARRLRAGERGRGLLRRSAAYCVSVYDQDYEALLAAGQLEVLDDQFAVLKDLSCYDADKGLCIPGMGIAIMI